MAVSKCYLCNKRLRGGDWKYKEMDGKPRKICMDERECNLRRAMHEKADEPAEEQDGGVTYAGLAVIAAAQIFSFGVGVVVGLLIC